MHGLWSIAFTLAACVAVAQKDGCSQLDCCSSVSLLQQRLDAFRGGLRRQNPASANMPWWLAAGVQQEGPDEDLGGFTAKTFSADQQAHYGVDEMGMIQDMNQFNAAMDELGHPELKNWSPDDGFAAPGLLHVRRQPVMNPMVNVPWWITAGIEEEGPQKDMGGFTEKTMSEEQQERFGVNELGEIQDMGKFNAAMDEIGHPELKNWSADGGEGAPGLFHVRRQPVMNPMVNMPWWITAGIEEEGPEKDMGGFTEKTFSEEQQETFGVDELGEIQDMEKFNTAMEEIGHPELKNWSADDGFSVADA